MVNRRSRLSRSGDFQRVYRQGSSTASRFLVLYHFKRPAGVPAGSPRLGLSVSKKIGGAVVRNRVKRLLREAFRECEPRLAKEYDYVFIARPQVAELAERGQPGAVRDAVVELLQRVGLLDHE